MTIKRKASKSHNYVQSDIEEKVEKKLKEVINRGGGVAQERKNLVDPEIRFTLRIQESLIKKIDKARKPRVGNISRNQWILEAISQALN